MWVFGYGSLIWKADFPYDKKLIGHIKGYMRRFYQKSTDHRGIPSKPGRVVTLIPSEDPNEEVWGLAYKISPENVESVTAGLDFREKGGYRRKTVLFYPYNEPNKIENKFPTENSLNDFNNTNTNNIVTSTDSADNIPFQLTIYIGEEGNLNYAGSEDINTIANHILTAHGPSGSNKEYLYTLALAMRTLAPNIHDAHLFTLEATVKKLEYDIDKETLKPD